MTKKLYIAVSFLLFIALVFSIAVIVEERYWNLMERNLYPKSVVVETVDAENDIVIVADSNGFLWGFSGCEDWQVGDVAAMIMDSRGTREIFDDAIVVVQCA